MTQEIPKQSLEFKPKKREVAHDETPSAISNHAFMPKGEWYTLCGYIKPDGNICNMAESAHTKTTLKR